VLSPLAEHWQAALEQMDERQVSWMFDGAGGRRCGGPGKRNWRQGGMCWFRRLMK